MKQFIGKLLFFSIFIILLLAFGISRVTTRWQGDYLFALIDKFDHLKTEESPKIVLIGGSNLAFGMDSETLSQYYDMPVVNMGLHAGIGLRFLLEGIKPYIHEDDLLIVIPEYGQFSGLYLGTSSDLIPTLFTVFPEGFKYVSFPQLLMVLSGIPRYAMDNLYDAYIKGHAFKKYEHNIYARSSFNQYGDLTAHWTEPSYISYEYKKEEPELIDRKMLRELRQYVSFYQSQGAKVAILPPALVNTAAQSMKRGIQQVTEELSRVNNEAFQYFHPQKYFIPDSLGYDTKYHLIKPGIDIRMHYLIEDLNTFLESQ